MSPTDPTANNHPVPSRDEASDPSTTYPKVPKDSRVTAVEDTAPGTPAAMRSIDTAK